jgi:hypothetical protein
MLTCSQGWDTLVTQIDAISVYYILMKDRDQGMGPGDRQSLIGEISELE